MTFAAPHERDPFATRAPGLRSRLAWAAVALAIASPIAILLARGAARHLWLDDLYTLALMKAESLPALWHAIVLGIDGNPPLYLTLAWLTTRAMPTADPIILLRIVNLAMVVSTLAILWSVLRRRLSREVAATSLALSVVAGTGFVQAGMALRTYALYLLAAAACLLLQLRVLEHRDPRDPILLAIAGVVLVFSHTFGIVYAGLFTTAAVLAALLAGDRAAAMRSLVAFVPAVLAIAAWFPGLMIQTEVARPYGWIPVPTVIDLVKSVMPSPIALIAAVLMAIPVVLAAVLRPREVMRSLPADAGGRFLALAGAGAIGVTLAAWTVSQIAFPIFVPRYLMPDVMLMLVLTTAFVTVMRRLGVVAMVVSSLAVAALCAQAFLVEDAILFGEIPCHDGRAGVFLEDGVRAPDLPLVTSSPHAMVPRRVHRGGDVLFPLDWDVVRAHPTRATNNATDFHIMTRLRDIGLVEGVVTTADLIARHRDFMVLEEPTRAWFDHLRATHDIDATLMREGLGCRLWRVRVK